MPPHRTVCSSPLLLKEEGHLSEGLPHCKYPIWTLNRLRIKNNTQNKPSNDTNNKNKPELPKKTKTYMVVPYTKGLNESVKNICNKHGMQVHFKGGRTIRNLLVAHKE